MKCQLCGIEMTRTTKEKWVCRNPKCINYPAKNKKEEK